MTEEQLARRERINEIYRAVWNPILQPGGGLPLTPDDHIHFARFGIKLGAPEFLDRLHAAVAKIRPDLADEWVRLLAEEAIATYNTR